MDNPAELPFPRLAVLGLGANLGSREALVRAAADLLAARLHGEVHGEGPVLVRSRLWATAPMGPPQPDYLNAAVAVRTRLSPRALLNVALGVETALGRVRGLRWGPRTVDIDVLWIDGETVDLPGLTVPHPGLSQRVFALGPLGEVAPDARDPRTGAVIAPEVESMARTVMSVRPFADGFDTVALAHTADEGFVVRATDRADLLAAAAEALGALAVLPASVGATTVVPVSVTAPGGDWPDDERMHAWLSEVLYHMDAGRLALRRAVVLADNPDAVHGLLVGESLDPSRHTVHGALKAVTWHALEVTADAPTGWRAQVVVDV